MKKTSIPFSAFLINNHQHDYFTSILLIIQLTITNTNHVVKQLDIQAKAKEIVNIQ